MLDKSTFRKDAHCGPFRIKLLIYGPCKGAHNCGPEISRVHFSEIKR
ncbi:hypothetical protein ACP70R_040148 [Stipagrostis hirtigluma subsp. patula]